MAERFSNSHEGDYKHLLEQDFAQSKLHSETNFWADMAQGLLPEAGHSIKEGFQTGEAWNAIGTGVGLAYGLNWMLNAARPLPTRIVGSVINTYLGFEFLKYTFQALNEVDHLKNKATKQGDYSNSVYEAQKLGGKVLADVSLGTIGGLAGHLTEPFAYRGINYLKSKLFIAETVPVGAVIVRPVNHANSVEESPHYLAMGQSRNNKKNQKYNEQRPFETKPEPKIEPTKPVELGSKVEPKSEMDLDPAETLNLLNEQAVRKGKPAAPETFENLQALRTEGNKETFNAIRTDLADQLGEKWFESPYHRKRGAIFDEVRFLRKSKNDEELAELLVNNTQNAAEPHVIEAMFDSVMNANNKFASEILQATKASPLVRDLFLEARSGKYPEDSYVAFTDEKGHLIRYTNDRIEGSSRTFSYPLKHIGNGLAEYDLISSDIVKGAVIFGSPHGGNRPLLGTVGDVPSRLADCGNYKEFFLKSRLDKNLSQFTFETGFKRDLSKGSECKGDVCPVKDLDFLAKVKAGREGVLSKPQDMTQQAKPVSDVIESLTKPGNKPDAIVSAPEAMPIKIEDMPRSSEKPASVSEPISATKIEPADTQRTATPELVASEQLVSKHDSKIAKLELEEMALRERLASEDRLSPKQIRDINSRLSKIERRKAAFGAVAKEQPPVTASDPVKVSEPIEVSEPTKSFDNSKYREFLEVEQEARLQGLPEGVYGKVSGFEPGFKERFDTSRDAWFKRREEAVRNEIEREAKELGLPEGVYGRYSEFNPGFKERFDEARGQYFARRVEEARAKEAEQAKIEPQPSQTQAHPEQPKPEQAKVEPQPSETEIKPESAGEKTWKKPERKTDVQLAVDLRLENELLADAFNAAGRGREGDSVVFFVKGDRGVIQRAGQPEGYQGKQRQLMVTKDDFHYGRVPVELLKNEIVGWAKIRPKVDKGNYVEVVNPRNPNQTFLEKEVSHVGGQVPSSLASIATDNIAKPYTDLLKIREKKLSTAKEPGTSGGVNLELAEMYSRRDSIQKQLDNHYQSIREGVDDGRLTSSEVLECKNKLERYEWLIAKEEGRAGQTSPESQFSQRQSTETTNAEHEPAKHESTRQQESALDKFAVNPAEPRNIRIEPNEKLTADIMKQLDSWKTQARPKTRPNDLEPTVNDRLDALVHVAYNVYSRARESLAQSKFADAEAWSMSLLKLLESDKHKERFDTLDSIRAYSLLGEIFRTQKKSSEAENCFKWARILLSDTNIRPSTERSLLEVGVLESYAKLLRSEPAQERIQQARELEVSRAGILEQLKKDRPTVSAGKWTKTVTSMRDRSTAQISMVNNAKWLDRSLQILNWFDIKL